MGSSELPILQWPSTHILLVSVVRLGLAALLGAAIGLQRERVHSSAGLRTHMLVSVGAAFFVLATIQAGATSADVSRVIQGLTAGVGFLGSRRHTEDGREGPGARPDDRGEHLADRRDRDGRRARPSLASAARGGFRMVHPRTRRAARKRRPPPQT